MKLTANERLGSLIIIAILALTALCLILRQRGDAPAEPRQVDTVIIERTVDTVKAVQPCARKRQRESAPPPTPRNPLSETF